jgi:hypothetical protein
MVGITWVIAITLGIAGILAALVYQGIELGLGALVLAVASWVALASLISHLQSLRRVILQHLKIADRDVVFVTHVLDAGSSVDFFRGVEHLRERSQPALPVVGVFRGYGTLRDAMEQSTAVSSLVWRSFPCGVNDQLLCVTNGVYRFIHDGQPIVAYLGSEPDEWMPESQSRHSGPFRPTLEVLAANREAARACLETLTAWARRNSLYRGAVISLESEDPQAACPQVRFLDMPPASRDSIILPAEVMQVVERNVLGMLRHSSVLKQANQSVRRGVLLHGPPGTGKTLVTRYLARACPDYSILVLTGRNLQFIRESCRLARFLAPAMLICEDVDLIASERTENKFTPLLHDLLDEMDGLGRKSDCIVILTTNRADRLEPALAARPGRVDQAVYFPLPDAACREKLLRLFGAELDLSGVNLGRIVDRTVGASPAFLEELCRRAALMASERIERLQDGARLPVEDRDFDASIREIVTFGGDLTKNLLGYSSTSDQVG